MVLVMVLVMVMVTGDDGKSNSSDHINNESDNGGGQDYGSSSNCRGHGGNKQ
jgi:hypothetical protein